MPGFKGIKMVSFEKTPRQKIAPTPQPASENTYMVWPEPAVSVMIDIMASFYTYIANTEIQADKEAYYQKAFEALNFHLMRLEQEKVLPANFLAQLTKEKMKDKWQEAEGTYKQISESLVPQGPPGQYLWPHFNKMAYILQGGHARTPETRTNPSPTKNPAPQNANSLANASPNAHNNEPLHNHTPPSSRNEEEAKEQAMISSIIEKSVPRVMETINAQQTQYQHTSAEKSTYEFQRELLRLKRRRVELLEEQNLREKAEREGTRALLSRLTDVLEKLNDKL